MNSRRHARAVFLFRRDLRVDDNLGLAAALEQADEVIPCFVLDPRQSEGHGWFSAPAFAFMLEALRDLDGQLRARGGRLHVLRGLPHELVPLLVEAGADAIYACRDYTPFSRGRDQEIGEACASRGASFVLVDDALLTRPEDVRTEKGTPYQVFGAFHRAASRIPIGAPRPAPEGRLFAGSLGLVEAAIEAEGIGAPRPWVRGGRAEALARLDALPSAYAATRDTPSLPTSDLSAYLKFGCISPREAAHAVRRAHGPHHELERQLAWRDFFTHLAWHAPRVFGEAFQERFARVEWDDDPERLQAWQEGRTGFPLVDAGMRQLRETGFMHNRVRMVTASFLVKDLHIDWRLGERHFARSLIDYDPCVNNGNWQWAASTGADAQPYFRIFNPWSQQVRHDPDAAYVREWVEELRGLDAATIHGLAKRRPPGLAYPEPIVRHAVEAREAQERFRRAAGA